MKKMMVLLSVILGLVLVSCEFVEYEAPKATPAYIESYSNACLVSALGYNSMIGVIYVQRNTGTILKIKSKTDNKSVSSATWNIEGKPYPGIQIAHKFTSLGTVDIAISIKYNDGSEENRNFTVQSVDDISTVDPVRYFVTGNNDGTWTVLFLFSKERTKNTKDSGYCYNGLVSNWTKKDISNTGKNYVIGIDGKPQKTSDVGKYIGASVILKDRGLYNIVLASSDNIWTDLSGSAFVKQENTGLAWFFFDSGIVTPNGDDITGDNLPGATGDNYFRFEQIGDTIGGKAVLYFKLDEAYTDNAFAVQGLVNGGYSNPIQMYPVLGFSDWGKIEVPITDLLNQVTSFRYGPNKLEPTTYSLNLQKPFSYEKYFNAIRVSLVNP